MNVLCVCVCVCVRVSGWGGRRGYGGRRRRAGKTSWEARKKARREEDEATEEPKHAPAPFITARDKHVRVHFPTNLLSSHKCFVRKTQFLNQQKKYGGRVSESSRTSQPQAISYGCSKKSLGTRYTVTPVVHTYIYNEISEKDPPDRGQRTYIEISNGLIHL